jgi:transposase
MAYSNDMKRLAMNLITINKKTHKETGDILKIPKITIDRWASMNKNNTLYIKKKRISKGRKVDDEALKLYVEENPFSDLEEIGKAVGLTRSGAHDALKRLKISYKKKLLIILKEKSSAVRRIKKQ